MDKPQWSKIDKQLVFEPQISGQPNLQLIAQVHGWQIMGKGTPPNFAGALMRIQPLGALIHNEDRTETVNFVDPTSTTIRTLMGIGLLVSAICWVIMTLAVRMIAHKN